MVIAKHKFYLYPLLTIASIANSDIIYAASDKDQKVENSELATEQGSEEEVADLSEDDSEGIEEFSIDELEFDDVNEEPIYTDLSIAFGQRTYDKTKLKGSVTQFTTEWSHQDYPLRFGPSFSYTQVKSSDDFYQKGATLELGARLSTFYDMEHTLPYLSVDYSFFSRGSINGSSRDASQEISGTVDLRTTGLDVVAGITFFIKDVPVFIEASLYSSKKIAFEVELGTATIGSDSNIAISNIDVDESETDSYKSILLGTNIEL